MANQELLNKQYKIPPDVLKSIQATLVSNPNSEGIKRAKFMLKNGVLTYQALKRLKNFFDYYNPKTTDKAQYNLAGGDLMKAFIETTLDSDRHAVATSKKVRQDMHVNPMSATQAFQTPRLNEVEDKNQIYRKTHNIVEGITSYFGGYNKFNELFKIIEPFVVSVINDINFKSFGQLLKPLFYTNNDPIYKILNLVKDSNDDLNNLSHKYRGIIIGLMDEGYFENINELNESKNKKKEELQKNAVAVIVNNDNKFLLLKRGKTAPWMPGKWSMVGGGIEKGETPQQAVEREIKEETGLEINKFIKTFTIQRNPQSIEHVFACRYEGDPTDIELDAENSNYGWYDIEEMNYLDLVPNLVEYIALSFKKYD